MALNAAIQWDVRTTGSDNNGGGFKAGATGTDYSMQDAAQYDLTTATTAAANAIILDAAAAAVMVGNVLQVISGTNFTPGFYEVISVVAGVSITVDRNCTTDAGALGVINIGGSLATISKASTPAVSGNKVWVKNGTYTETATMARVSSGQTYYIGYNATHGDNPTDDNRPLITGSSARANCIVVSGVSGTVYISYFRCTGATGDGVYMANSSNFMPTFLFWVKSYSNGSDGFYEEDYSWFYMCESNNNTATGFNIWQYKNSYLFYCYIHDNTGAGFLPQTGSSSQQVIIGCIADSNGSTGLGSGGGNSHIVNSIAYNNTGATTAGILVQTNGSFVFNAASISNGKYGFSATAERIPFFNYNAYNGNGTSGLNNITAGANDVTDAPSFTDAVNGDFSLAAGSPLIDAGFPAHAMAGATV